MSEGRTLSQATKEIAERLGLRSRVLPMSDNRVETRIETPTGEISFEEYFVQRRYQDPVKSVRFAGAAEARPAPGVLDAIASAETVLIAPSNPVTSIGPILAVPGVRDALRTASAPIIAVSPIIGRQAVSGPAATLMAAQGLQASIAGVATAYEDFLQVLVVDDSDSAAAEGLASSRLQVQCTNILMRSSEDKACIARTAVTAASGVAHAAEVK
jgi:LPPG:FO 2-phospho-L-lactate transferase